MSKLTIHWQKYEDSVNNDLNISKLLMTGKFVKETEKEVKEEEYLKHSYQEEDEDEDEQTGHFVMQFPITAEMMYNIKLCSDYECWVGHCNFDITQPIVSELNLNVPGVEYLKPLTRYRFLVGIGKAFEFSKVRSDIQQKLGTLGVIDE